MAKFEDREKRRKTSIIGSMINRVPVPAPPPARSGRGRPKENRETKKRVSLSVLPSLYEDIRKIAFIERRSISDLIGELMEQYRTQHRKQLAEYEKMAKKAPRKSTLF